MKHHLGNEIWRTRARQHDPTETTDYLSENELERIMINNNWRLIGQSRAADNIGVDYVYRKEHAEIDIQVKGATISEDRNWAWQKVKGAKGLNMDFYGERGNFLFLVGLDEKKTNVPQEVLQVALVPVHKVAKYFQKVSRQGTSCITICEKKLDEHMYTSEFEEWDDCFGATNIERILFSELNRQQEEYELLKQFRQWKDQGECTTSFNWPSSSPISKT